MSQCALAASHTVSEDFTISSLYMNFLLGPSAQKPLTYRVASLSDGGRFVVRSVILEQDGKKMVHATVNFMRNSPWTGTAMSYSSKRRTNHTVARITMDDLEDGRGPLGGFMRFQRLPIVFGGNDHDNVSTGITSSAAHIIPAITNEEDVPLSHMLGLISLSDYHVLDSPLQLHGIGFGLPRIGDKHGQPAERQIRIAASLNHSIHFHRTNGWRADEIMYIEVSTCWAKDGRAMIRSEIFDQTGVIVATCVQEGFYVLQKGVKL